MNLSIAEEISYAKKGIENVIIMHKCIITDSIDENISISLYIVSHIIALKVYVKDQYFINNRYSNLDNLLLQSSIIISS